MQPNHKPSSPFNPDMRLPAGPDAGGMAGPLADGSAWRKRRAEILAAMELVMGPLPDRSNLPPLDVEVLETFHLPGIERRKLTFVAEQEDRVPAYLLVPEGLAEKTPAVLCLHQTTKIGKGEPMGLGGKPNLHYGLELARRGYVTLAPDYPGFGDNTTDPYARGYVSATMKGIWNHMRAVDLLQSLPEVDGGRIGCIGHSLGGHNTLFVAAFDTRLTVMVSSCGFNSFPKYKGGDLSRWSKRAYMPRIADVYGKDPRRIPFDFPDVASALAPRAFFVNAPVNDDNFEVSGVRDCVDAAMSVYKSLGAEDRLTSVYPDAAHDFPTDVQEAAYTFVDAALKGEN